MNTERFADHRIIRVRIDIDLIGSLDEPWQANGIAIYGRDSDATHRICA